MTGKAARAAKLATTPILIAAIANLALAQPAYAYVDPSVMTYTIQALAGVAVALGAVAGVAFRRTRKALFSLFRIDENAGKTVEPDVRRLRHGEDRPDAQARAREAQEARAREARRADRTDRFGRRILLSAVASFFAVFTLLVVAPLEIYLGGQSDLSVDVLDVVPVLVPAAAALFAALACLLSLLRGRAFRIALGLVTGLGICFYLQALFLNTGLPSADGTAFSLAGHEAAAAVSLAVWIAVIVLAVFLGLKFARPAQNALACLSLALVVVQGAGIAGLLSDHVSAQAAGEAAAAAGEAAAAAAAGDGDWHVTQDGLFDLSGTNNVVVFALDTFEDADITQALGDDPAILDEFTGFTRYTDCLELFEPTRYAMPFLLTGEQPDAGESFETYMYERYARGSFLDRIADAGYSIGIYSDSLGIDETADESAVEHLTGLTVNLHELQGEQDVDPWATLEILYRCALYRDLTWLCKAPFWFYTDEINQKVVSRDPSATDGETLFVSDDAAYSEELEARGLRIDDEDNAGGAFRVIHLQGAHEPYSLNENGADVGEGNSDKATQVRGTLKIVARYLSEMKRLGLYEDATVIVMSDHGTWRKTDDVYINPHNSLMMVKPSGSSTGQPVLNGTLVSQVNFHATVLAAVGASAEGFQPALQDVQTDMALRTYYQLVATESADQGMAEWAVTGSSTDASSWSQTGLAWVFKDGAMTVEAYREAAQTQGPTAGSGPATSDSTGVWPSSGPGKS